MFYTSKYREDSITIDLSDRPLEGDDEYIQISLKKSSMKSSGHRGADFLDQTGKPISSDKGSKFLFFGTKFSLK